jgi:replicative DNA helicase
MTEELMQPHDLRAEEEVLGALLTTNCFGAIQAEIGLRSECFYRDSHGLVFGAMVALASEGKPTDEISVGNSLATKADALERAGGRNRLAELAAMVRSPGHAMHYAEMVRDKAQWRQRFDAAMHIRVAAAHEDSDAFASAQARLVEDSSQDRRLYDSVRQRDLMFELTEGKAKAEFFWPFDKLNKLQSGGMRRGQLIVLSGYTNEGKSHFAGQLLDLNRKHGKVCLYDNEMDPVEQTARRAARLAGVPYGALLDGKLDQKGLSQANKFMNADDLHWPIVDTSGWTVEEVALHIRQYRWDFVVIDILHNFPFDDERQLSASVARLKAAARLARCCIVLVAHVNRGGIERGKRRRPVRSDLRWSGDIENLADAVCFVYREQDEETLEPTEDGFIYLDKCRGGELGGQPVRFFPPRLRFEARDLHDEPPPQW